MKMILVNLLLERYRTALVFSYRTLVLILMLIAIQKIDSLNAKLISIATDASDAAEYAEQAFGLAEVTRSAAIGADINASKAVKAAEAARSECLFQALQGK
ncbi:hypothetical protein [Methyloversatilis sp.]|nr:hypothetical protein [Methyloversatilis sp.]